MKSLLYQYNSDPSNKNISLTIGTSTFRNERAIQDLEIIENMIADINENKIEATVNMIIEKGYNKSPYLEQLANLILYFVSIKENKISIYLKLIDELSKNCEIIHWLKCHLYSKSETRSLVFEKIFCETYSIPFAYPVEVEKFNSVQNVKQMLSAIEDDHVEELKQYIQKYSIDIHCYYEVPIPIIKRLFKKHPKITLLMYSAYCCSKKCFEYLFNNSSLEDITQNEYNKKMTHHNFKIMGLTIQVSSIVDYSIIGGSLDILKKIANVKNIEFSVSHLIFSIIMHNIDMFEYIIKNITFCATKEFAVFCIIYHFIHGYQHIKQCNLRDMIAYSCMFGNYTFLDTSFQKWKEETIDTIYYLDLKSPFYEIMNWILLKKRQTQKYTDCSVYSIVDACLSNNIDLLNLLIKENADINEVSLNKKNTAIYPLQIVCLRGYIDLFNVLIEHSKINLHLYQIHAVITPLMAASFGKNLSIVERIYNLCPETLNIGIKNGKFQIEIFPLTVAILSRRNDIAKYLLSLPNINIDSLSILKCLDQENIEIFQKMISLDEVKYHKLWTSSNLKQDSPLMKIIQKENIEMIKLIIYNSSVDINALHYLCAAVELGNIDIVKIICSQPKIDMHKKDLQKFNSLLIRSPLYIAVIKNNLEIFNLLLFHSNFDINKEINTKSSFRTQNVLDYIIKNDLIEYFKIIMLIKNIQFDKSFEQLLCYCYSESKTEIIKFVVKSHKIYLEQNDNSLLGLACQQNDIDMVKFLLENGEINQNLNQMEQRYLVHRHDLINIACQNNNINLCQLLFADKRIIMNDELFPQSLKYACENKNIELIHLLLSRPNISKKSLLSSIKITSIYEFLEIAQNILKNFQITQEDLISLLPIQEENLLLFDLIIKNVSRQNIIQKKEIFVKSLLSSIDHGYSQKFIDIQINTIFDVITDVETIYSILLRACSNNMVDLVEKILYRKRFLYVSKTVGKYESFPLYTACQRGYLDIVKLLLKFPNININQRTRSLF